MNDTRLLTTCTVCGGLLQRRGNANGDFWVAVSIGKPYPNRCQTACRPNPEGELAPHLADYFLFALSRYGINDASHRSRIQRCAWSVRHPVRARRTRRYGS